jgi:hypothetical protein
MLSCRAAGYSGDVVELRQHLKSRRETSHVEMLPAIIARSVHTLTGLCSALPHVIVVLI